MKIISEDLIYLRATREFEIEVGDKIINITKWILDEDPEFDHGWEFASDKDKKVYDSLSEDVQDNFQDFVHDLGVLKI